MRRAGKSVFAHLLSRRSTYSFLSFDDERLIEFKSEHSKQLIEVSMIEWRNRLLSFRWIQNISGMELFVTEYAWIIKSSFTGSNSESYGVRKFLGTPSHGRFDVWQLFPMSFLEFLTYKNMLITQRGAFSTVQNQLLKFLFDEYSGSWRNFEGHLFGQQRLRTMFSRCFSLKIFSCAIMSDIRLYWNNWH